MRFLTLFVQTNWKLISPAVDSLQVVLSTSPVVLNRLNILDDVGIQPAVERVVGVGLPWLGPVQVLHPIPPVCKALPQAVGVYLQKYSVRLHD